MQRVSLFLLQPRLHLLVLLLLLEQGRLRLAIAGLQLVHPEPQRADPNCPSFSSPYLYTWLSVPRRCTSLRGHVRMLELRRHQLKVLFFAISYTNQYSQMSSPQQCLPIPPYLSSSRLSPCDRLSSSLGRLPGFSFRQRNYRNLVRDLRWSSCLFCASQPHHTAATIATSSFFASFSMHSCRTSSGR